MSRLALAAFALFASCAVCAADRKPAEAKLPEVPETLTPAQADAFLAKLTDAQARALLARELQGRAQKQAAAEAPSVDRSFGSWLMQAAEGMEGAPVDMSRHGDLLMQGMARLPTGLSAGVARIFGDRGNGGVFLQLVFLAAVLVAGALASFGVR
ncbi:MAG TPA: hypothetical protein VE935_23830, partial [Burkholderiales bacterium]|nr:hypothetical protein [Burkholderiales bacterium]